MSGACARCAAGEAASTGASARGDARSRPGQCTAWYANGHAGRMQQHSEGVPDCGGHHVVRRVFVCFDGVLVDMLPAGILLEDIRSWYHFPALVMNACMNG